MREYKGWTDSERRASYKKTKEAIEEGVIPKATECNWCGQNKGIIEYHNEDYSHPLMYLVPVCYRCHMLHHSRHRNEYQVDKYFFNVRVMGMVYEPIYSRNYKIIVEDHLSRENRTI